MRLVVFLSLSLLIWQKGWTAGPVQLVLLDRSGVQAESVTMEKGMLACTLKNQKKLLLSVGLIDWEFTKRTAPHVYEMACPGSEKKEIEKKLAKLAKGPEKGIVITNDELDAMEPYQRDESQWVTRTPTISGVSVVAKPGEMKTPSGGSGPIIQTIGGGGAKIDITGHMERGKYVMFDFFAHWCGPCRQLTPKMENFVRRFPDRVALKKIDIVRWGTPVTKQYGVNAVPHVKLYNPDGRKVREGNGFQIVDHLESISQKEGW